MAKTQHPTDDQLLNYLDGTLSATEAAQVLRLAESHADVRARLNELRTVHLLLKQSKTEAPSEDFTANVMAALTAAPSSGVLPVRSGLWLLAGVLVAAGLAALLLSMGVFDQVALRIDLPSEGLPQQYVPQSLPTVFFSGKVMVNIIIMLNLAVAWLMLDRAVLKPYFQRRMRTGH